MQESSIYVSFTTSQVTCPDAVTTQIACAATRNLVNFSYARIESPSLTLHRPDKTNKGRSTNRFI